MNKKAFTLIEMMIVLIIITGMMFLIIPNVVNSKRNIENKTCEAYITLVESQIQAYIIDTGNPPLNIETLVIEKYLKSESCPNGKKLEIVNEKVRIVE